MQRVTTGIRMQAFQANTQPQYVAYNMPHTLPQTPFMPRPGIVRPTPRWSTQQVTFFLLQVENKAYYISQVIDMKYRQLNFSKYPSMVRPIRPAQNGSIRTIAPIQRFGAQPQYQPRPVRSSQNFQYKTNVRNPIPPQV